jgi:hypothetical protein
MKVTLGDNKIFRPCDAHSLVTSALSQNSFIDGKLLLTTSLTRKEGCGSLMGSLITWPVSLLSTLAMQEQAVANSLSVLTWIHT